MRDYVLPLWGACIAAGICLSIFIDVTFLILAVFPGAGLVAYYLWLSQDTDFKW
jgi:hypothetical protein